MINKKLIHFNTYSAFEDSRSQLYDYSIAFIAETKQIYTHGNFYDCDIENINELNDKVDKMVYVFNFDSSAVEGTLTQEEYNNIVAASLIIVDADVQTVVDKTITDDGIDLHLTKISNFDDDNTAVLNSTIHITQTESGAIWNYAIHSLSINVTTNNFEDVISQSGLPEVLQGIQDEIPTKVSQLENDTNYGTVSSITAGTGLSGGTITSSGTISLASSGVTAGSQGPTAAVTGNYNTSVAIPRITVDTYGRVTSLSSYEFTTKGITGNGTITNIVKVSSLPSSPDANTLYIIV